MWNLNNVLLYKQWARRESKEKFKRLHLERNENENAIYQYLRDPAKAVLRAKFIAINPYLRKNKHLKQHHTSKN